VTATTTGFDWAKTLKVHITLETLDCCNCGIPFAVPADYCAHLREHPELSFYCPNGHSMHYPGKTEAEKQKERADRAEQDLAAERREHRRTKRKAAAGVCPVKDCRRPFENLARHIATKHPGFRSETGLGHVHLDGPYGIMQKVSSSQGRARYRCPCGWTGFAAGGRAARHARTCKDAR
jgi:hypothetical protein